MNSIIVKYNSLRLILIFCTTYGYSQSIDNRIFDPATVQISEISTNTILSEFAPAIVKNSLYFVSLSEKLLTKENIKSKEREIYHLFNTTLDSLGNATGKREPASKFTTPFNDGPVSYCAKTEELFMTQNYNNQIDTLKPFQTEVNRLRIIIAKWENGKWVQNADFPYNNPKYSVGHPAITEAGDTLIFSSDKPGGFGETDLYYSVRKKGKWKNPVNLGHRINTNGKEEFPFISDRGFNGRFLIFSSNGRSGKSNYDLYYTRYPSSFKDITRFESPINGEYDDFSLTIPSFRDYGYMTSNRPGSGSDDIYKFTFKRANIPKSQPAMQIDENTRSLTVLDKKSNIPIPGVKIVACNRQVYTTDQEGKVRNLPCKWIECELVATKAHYYDNVRVLKECTDSREKLNEVILMESIKNEQTAFYHPVPILRNSPSSKTVPATITTPRIEPAPPITNTQKIESVPKVNEVPPPSAKPAQFNLILGSYNKRSEAVEFMGKLKSEGYETTLCSESAPFRVGLGYSDLNKAKAELEVLKKKFKGAWIMKR